MFLAREPLKQATVKFYDAMTPLFEPRCKSVALKEKKAAKPARRRRERRTAAAPRRRSAKEDGESMMARQQKNRTPDSPSPRERAIEAYDSIAGTGPRAGWTGSPLLALGGGLGARRAGRRAASQDRGPKSGCSARSAAGSPAAPATRFDAAKEAGREKLSELNITRDAGKGAVQSLVDGLHRGRPDQRQGSARSRAQQGLIEAALAI